jgi:protoheme IX farnesyltransferase
MDVNVSRPAFRDYLELTKPRLSLLSVLTALVGYVVARAPWEWSHFILTMVATSACAAGVAALNQWMESDTDARMRRTAQRPIPTGKVPAGSAFVLGWGLCMAGLAIMFVWASALASLFALLTIVAYLACYTPAKRWSRWSTEIGAVAGAFPPLIGWTAATGGLAPLGWVLFGILLVWQIPHFMAIAWYYRHDYATVNFPMLPVRDTTGVKVARWSLVNTIAAVALSTLPYWLGETGLPYLGGTLALGAWFLWRALAMLRAEGRDAAARRLFLASVIWLPLQLGSLVLDRLTN